MEPRIIVDSCCDMTKQLKARLGTRLVPLIVRLGNKEFIDDESLDYDDYLHQMIANTEKSGTAAPSPGAFQEAIEAAKNSFVITLSSKLSVSYQSALLGKQLAENQGSATTHVFDSKSVSAGQILVALKLKELIQMGLSRELIIQKVEQFIGSVRTLFVLDRYENLVNSGRVSHIKGKLVSILKINLLMGDDGDGNIALHATTRGKERVINKMVSFVVKSGKDTSQENLVITHCNNEPLAQRLADTIGEQVPFKEILVTPMRAVSSYYADDKGIIMAF